MNLVCRHRTFTVRRAAAARSSRIGGLDERSSLGFAGVRTASDT
jgi:hypothetical protein